MLKLAYQYGQLLALEKLGLQITTPAKPGFIDPVARLRGKIPSAGAGTLPKVAFALPRGMGTHALMGAVPMALYKGLKADKSKGESFLGQAAKGGLMGAGLGVGVGAGANALGRLGNAAIDVGKHEHLNLAQRAKGMAWPELKSEIMDVGRKARSIAGTQPLYTPEGPSQIRQYLHSILNPT